MRIKYKDMGVLFDRENLKRKQDQMDESIKLGIKNLTKEGYTKERLYKIIANEELYQEYLKKSHPSIPIPIGTQACVVACRILLQKL